MYRNLGAIDAATLTTAERNFIMRQYKMPLEWLPPARQELALQQIERMRTPPVQFETKEEMQQYAEEHPEAKIITFPLSEAYTELKQIAYEAAQSGLGPERLKAEEELREIERQLVHTKEGRVTGFIPVDELIENWKTYWPWLIPGTLAYLLLRRWWQNVH